MNVLVSYLLFEDLVPLRHLSKVDAWVLVGYFDVFHFILHQILVKCDHEIVDFGLFLRCFRIWNYFLESPVLLLLIFEVYHLLQILIPSWQGISLGLRLLLLLLWLQ